MSGMIIHDPKKRVWRVEAPPHILMRLKRVIGKCGRAYRDTIVVTDTPENCRDLEWFTQRYPMDVDPRPLLIERAAVSRERDEVAGSIISGLYQPRRFELAEPAREYQRLAAELALQTGGMLLADDVGLGKTLSAICALTDPRTRPALVVTLAHLPRQWEAELKRFAPQLRTHILKKGTPYPLGGSRPGQPELFSSFPDVIITNYHKLSGWAGTLAGVVKSVVFDECQELRRGASDKYKAAARIANAADVRIGLSATPIYNFGGEFYNVIECIRPAALGSRAEFAHEWCGGWGDDKARIKDPVAFGSYLKGSGLMLRRTRADVGRELPDLTQIPHIVDSDTGPIDAVETRATELARLILDTNKAAGGVKWHAAQEISMLVRQATGVSKAPYVADFVRLLVESGESVVLFGWHREVYSLWMERLKDLAPVMYTGSESPAQKEAARQKFVAGESKVFIMSLRSGAGLDGLQRVCRTVVFGELDWSPGVHTQCIGRVHRDGQPEKVVAYYLLADSGSDPVVADVLGLKRQQLELVRDHDKELVEQLEIDPDHVRKLAASILAARGESIPVPGAEAAAA